MIRIVTDATRGELGYGGPPVPIKHGIDIDDLKRDMQGPSGTELLILKQRNAMADVEFAAFVRALVAQPTGAAAKGNLTWETS